MEFYAMAQGKMGLRHIPPVLADLLREIPHCLQGDTEAAEVRFFPDPSTEPEEEAFREDWKAFVEPELQAWFQSTRQVVEADLRGLRQREGQFAMEIPLKHADAWLNALNQARLSLAARHQFGEKDLSHAGPMPIQNERDYALLQINFYAALQQWLVEVVDRD